MIPGLETSPEGRHGNGLQAMGVAKELDMTEGLNSNNNEENFSRCLHQSLVLIQNIAHLIKDLRRKTTKYSK